jgi:two-component system, response regulator PdtaR
MCLTIEQTISNMNAVKVLVVEDHRIIARDITNLLTDWHYNVVGCATTSEQALSLYHTHKPDLALIDISLASDSDGIALAQTINRLQPIPFVYLTAQADKQTVERAKMTQPAAYLLKPFEERSLQISLELALSNFCNRSHIEPKIIGKNDIAAHEVKLGADSILNCNGAIFIKQNYRFVKFERDSLLVIEAAHNYTYLCTSEHRFIIRLSMASILEKLACPSLVRIHRSFAVNINHIKEFSDEEIKMTTGKTVPITTAYREDFLKHFGVL